MCADESDNWSTCISNICDDFVPEDVVFHLCISVVTFAPILDSLDRCIFFDFSLTVKAASHECVNRTGLLQT